MLERVLVLGSPGAGGRRPPFPGEGYALIKRTLTEEAPPLEGVPRALSELVRRLLAKDPAARPGIDEVLRVLEPLAGDEPARSPTRALPALAAGALLGAAATVLALRAGTPAPGPRVEAPPPVARAPGPRPPTWYESLRPERRPSLPLPPGITFDAIANQYWSRDGSLVLYVPEARFAEGGVARVVTAFFAGKFEVTVARFENFAKTTGYVTDAERRGGARLVKWDPARRTWAADAAPGTSWRRPFRATEEAPPDCPVVAVSWNDARAYAAWAGASLLTRDQWTAAALWDGERVRAHPWGDTAPGPGTKPFANLADETLASRFSGAFEAYVRGYSDGYAGFSHVGSWPEGTSPWGLADAFGNVREWTDEVRPDGTVAARGGGFYDVTGEARYEPRDACSQLVGFRIACPVSAPPSTIGPFPRRP